MEEEVFEVKCLNCGRVAGEVTGSAAKRMDRPPKCSHCNGRTHLQPLANDELALARHRLKASIA